jgi:hypothetical protein
MVRGVFRISSVSGYEDFKWSEIVALVVVVVVVVVVRPCYWRCLVVQIITSKTAFFSTGREVDANDEMTRKEPKRPGSGRDSQSRMVPSIDGVL